MMNIFFENFSNDVGQSITQRYPGSVRFIEGSEVTGWPLFKAVGTAEASQSILRGNPFIGNLPDRLEVYLTFSDNGDTTGKVAGTTLTLFNLITLVSTDTNFTINGNISDPKIINIEPNTIDNLYLDVNYQAKTITVFVNGNLVLLREPVKYTGVMSTAATNTDNIVRFTGASAARQPTFKNTINGIVAATNNDVSKMLDVSTLKVETPELEFVDQTGFEKTGDSFTSDVNNANPLDGDSTIYAIELGSITFNKGAVSDPTKVLASKVYIGARTDTERAIEVVGGDYFIPVRTLMAYPPMTVTGDQIKVEVIERKAFKALLDVTGATSLSPRFVGAEDIVIDWGDGTSTEVGSAARADHAYNTPGQYVVQITGKCKDLTFAHPMFVELLDWGENLEYEHVQFWKANASGDPAIASEMLVKIAEGLPKSVTNMSNMFNGCSSFNQPLNFDTSNVTIMSYMFNGCSSFNQPLNFDTSNVTDMGYMFQRCSAFNQPLNFDTSNVTNMRAMVAFCPTFNQPLNFDTSNVTDMAHMFRECSAFNQPLNFDTSNVIDMYAMFYGCSTFNQPLNFDTSNVTNMSLMFSDCRAFNQDLSRWCVQKITSKPNNFDYNTPAWSRPRPRWGQAC